ncbi:MAG: acetyl-CoA carboxylase carboxyl transferase subunit alpha, partial [Marinomonas sp.]
MKVTAQHLKRLGVIDAIIPEPVGGAHRDPAQAAQNLGKALAQELETLCEMPAEDVRRMREDRFLAIGAD